MENINIDDLSLDELYNLQSSVSEHIKKIKEEKEKENQKKAEQHRIEYENKKNAYYKKLDDFTKDSSIILKELINKYEQICNLDISSLSQEEKLKLYVQKAYIENLMIGGGIGTSLYKINVGISSYDGDINSFLENGMDNLYDYIYFSVKKSLNERLINICMKKIARLKGKSDDFIMKISNFSSSSLIHSAYYNSQDLLYLIDNIDNFFEQDSAIYTDQEGKIHVSEIKVYRDIKDNNNNYPLSNISIENKKMINQYLCNKLKFNGSISDKYEFLINSMARLYSVQNNSTIDESLKIVKKWIDSITSKDNLKRNLTESNDFEKFEYGLFINMCRICSDIGFNYYDLPYNNKNKYVYSYYFDDAPYIILNENSIPVFMTEEEEENFKKAFNIGEIGSK